jgi:hypothetical protein
MSAQLSIRKEKLVEWLQTELELVNQQIFDNNRSIKGHYDKIFDFDILSYKVKYIESQIKKLSKELK